MPGSFGTTNNDDGAVVSTNSNTKSGIFARNDSTGTASALGGSGVFGLTVAPGAAGVFGANNSSNSPNNTGRGVLRVMVHKLVSADLVKLALVSLVKVNQILV